ncbi:MAG: hypothetical protein Q7S65_04125 [Nanoarchaeota archaeon]|nr:hypothetical protein [Nanoarchaeota archaeon]
MDELKTWALNYFKSRDAFTKSIIAIEDAPDGFSIQYKGRKDKVVIVPQIASASKEAIVTSQCLVTLNEPKNIDALIARWPEFKTRDMKLIFVLPSQPHKKWVLNPFAHARVCDESSLKRGLYALAEELP